MHLQVLLYCSSLEGVYLLPVKSNPPNLWGAGNDRCDKFVSVGEAVGDHDVAAEAVVAFVVRVQGWFNKVKCASFCLKRRSDIRLPDARLDLVFFPTAS